MSEISKFYTDQWPALTLPGWTATGAESYGLVWWENLLPTEHPDLNARLTFLVRPSSTQIGLEVRHSYCSDAVALAQIGSGDTAPSQILSKAGEKMPDLKAEVLQKYETWSAECRKMATPFISLFSREPMKGSSLSGSRTVKFPEKPPS